MQQIVHTILFTIFLQEIDVRSSYNGKLKQK